MFANWKLGRWAGIDVTVHWSFWLLLAYYGLGGLASGGAFGAVVAVAFILAIFACVVAHEFGHALAAASYGIPTHDITVLPFGGVARLSRVPEKPWQEFVIAVAGPLVNVVIAASLFVALWIGNWSLGDLDASSLSVNFLGNLLAANVGLVLFNMLPAFPMDGGRVLRSLLAMRMPHLRATEIAAKIGRWMAGIFLVVALVYGHLGLLMVSAFIFFAGTMELLDARRRAMPQPAWSGWVWTSGGDPQSVYANQSAHANWPVHTNGSAHASQSDTIDAVEVREIPPKHALPKY